jgi:rfaE bifunctional protein kinase chain/domain
MNLDHFFVALQHMKALIIGDVMVDSYIKGKVDRISPEAPVPVLHVRQRENRLGGAANVALNIQSLGAEPILCSIIGEDPQAEVFRGLLKKQGMTDRGIISSPHRTTTQKHRVISGSHHLIRIDEEEDSPLCQADKEDLIAHIHQMVEECDVVIFEDYDKGTLDEDVISATIAAAKSKGIPVTVDPKRRNFLKYHEVSLFKPNLKELKEGLNIDIDPNELDQVKSAVGQLKDKLNFENAMITLSEHGIYFESTDAAVSLPAHVRSISDVSGAGDTVISIASLCLAAGLSAEVIAELSNLGGGIVCEYPGVVPINKDRLKAEAKINPVLETYFD